VLRSPYNLKAGESFSFYLSDKLSTEHKDWPFFEFENVFADFDNYEKLKSNTSYSLYQTPNSWSHSKALRALFLLSRYELCEY